MPQHNDKATDTDEGDAVALDRDEAPTESQAQPGADTDTDNGDSPKGGDDAATDADAALASLREELTGEAPKEDEPEAKEAEADPKKEATEEQPEGQDDADDADDSDEADEAEAQKWHPAARRSRRRLLKERARLREQIKERETHLGKANEAFSRLTEACRAAGVEPKDLPRVLKDLAEARKGGQQHRDEPRGQEQQPERLPEKLQLLVDTGELTEDEAQAAAMAQARRREPERRDQRQDDRQADEGQEAHLQAFEHAARELDQQVLSVFGDDAEQASQRILAAAKEHMTRDNMREWPRFLRIAAEAEIRHAKSQIKRPTKTVPSSRAAGAKKQEPWEADLAALRSELVG